MFYSIHKVKCFYESSEFECLLHQEEKTPPMSYFVLLTLLFLVSCSSSICVIMCNSGKVMNELCVAQGARCCVSRHQTCRKRCCWLNSQRLQCRSRLSQWHSRPFSRSDSESASCAAVSRSAPSTTWPYAEKTASSGGKVCRLIFYF